MAKPTQQPDIFHRHLSDSETRECITFESKGLQAQYYPKWVDHSVADRWYEALMSSVNWSQDEIVVYGKRHLTPRLSCWMGEPWMSYSYSQHTMQPEPWQGCPREILQKLEASHGDTFNSVLINLYRDGKDSNGWHADDEPELGKRPVIASVSLGAARDFYLREKANHANKVKLNLAHGSLLIMSGDTQKYWQHHVPKRANSGPRINLTYRTMVKM